MFGCKHSYVEVRRQFNPRSMVNIDAKGFTSKAMQYFIYGRTNVELRCKKCGDIEFKSTPGRIDDK